MIERIVLVTRRTRLEGLVARFNTRRQARFTIERSGGDFSEYEREDDAYRRALETVRRALDLGLKLQVLDRGLVPTYLFSGEDLVVALGQDGLVANTAKYAGVQPIVGVNPDPERFDGLLLPFLPPQARAAVGRAVDGTSAVRRVTLAEARLADGQRLLGFNELLIGARTHVSARYRVDWGGRSEPQSSSGILVSTGAGSTGWLSSAFHMASSLAALRGQAPVEPLSLAWEDPRLVFVVREPFASRHSGVSLGAGVVEGGKTLRVASLMPSGGVIFSDGVEEDFLSFDSGAVAEVRAAGHKACLCVP